MIACACTRSTVAETRNNELAFEDILPVIKRFAKYAFRHVRYRLREDLVAESVANAYSAFVRLVNRGLRALIYPSALARFAIRQVWDGRRVGRRRIARDVMSEYAQSRRAIVVEQLDYKNGRQPWTEQLLADRRATPADLVACKLDFCAWLARLSEVKRKVALRLAVGDTGSEAASRFRLSVARISQIRRELFENWSEFQGLARTA